MLVAVLPLLAASHSAAAFKKLLSLAGDWEGKDEHGMAVTTSFKPVAANTALLETLTASGMEDANHITETWTWRKNDKDTLMVFHFSRRK